MWNRRKPWRTGSCRTARRQAGRCARPGDHRDGMERPQGVPRHAARRADRICHPHAVHPPRRGPLRRRHVPALRARLQRALRGCRLEQLLNSGIGAPEGSRTREPPSATHAQHATVLLVRESVVFCLSCLLRPKGRGKQRNGGFA